MRSCISVLCTFLLLTFIAPAYAARNGGVSVKDSVDSTLQYHRQLKSIQENRQAAVFDLRRQQSGWYPRVDATARVGGSYLSDSGTRLQRTDKDMYHAGFIGITAVQPLWDGLATYNRVKMAEYQLFSLDHRVLDNATSLTLEAVIAHSNVELRRLLLKYAHENVKQHVHILAAQTSREAGGTTTVADVDQVQGRVARARSQLADAQGQLALSEDNYYRVTGRTVPPQLEDVKMPSLMFSGAESCYDAAQRSNPKLLAYREDIKRARAQQSLATAAYSSTLNIEASSGASNKDGSNRNWSNYTDVMLVGRWNLFNGGADVAGERVAAAQHRQVQQDTYDLADALRQQVHNAWSNMTTSIEVDKFYTQAIGFNKRTRDGFMEQFLIGQRGLLDVLDASSELYNSSVQQATARTNTTIAAYTMSALSGDILNIFTVDKKALLRDTTKGVDEERIARIK